jgi:hypothetical protein
VVGPEGGSEFSGTSGVPGRATSAGGSSTSIRRREQAIQVGNIGQICGIRGLFIPLEMVAMCVVLLGVAAMAGYRSPGRVLLPRWTEINHVTMVAVHLTHTAPVYFTDLNSLSYFIRIIHPHLIIKGSQPVKIILPKDRKQREL